MGAPILGYPYYCELFIIETDAPFKELGDVLSQEVKERERSSMQVGV